MLPRLIAIILLLASIVVAGKLIYDTTIFHFWTTPWVAGVLCTLGLIAGGIALLFLDDEDTGCVALSIFGFLYTVASFFVYIAWSYRCILLSPKVSEFFGFLVLCGVTTTVAVIGLLAYSEDVSNKIFMFPAWCFAFASVVSVFMVIQKYVFRQEEWLFWPFVGEIVILTVGAVWFLAAYDTAKTAKRERLRKQRGELNVGSK